MSDDADEYDRSLAEMLPIEVTLALEAALRNNDIPAGAIGCYVRWWQLETWLRTLSYIELRAQYGMTWADHLSGAAHNRQANDKAYEYMASPDWQNPLAYLDASKLFQVIDDHWSLFEYALPIRESWNGRKVELLAIRNRIGHLRRPHRDDLAKLGQTLRDLEHGAFKLCVSYNEPYRIDDSDGADPIAQAYLDDAIPGAQKLIEHASKQYRITVQLGVICRPWSEPLEGRDVISGKPGHLWSLHFHTGIRDINVQKFWTGLSASTRLILVHVLGDVASLRVTFSVVDDQDRVLSGIADCIHTALGSIPVKDGQVRRYRNLDSRVLTDHALNVVNSDTVPVTIFSA